MVARAWIALVLIGSSAHAVDLALHRAVMPLRHGSRCGQPGPPTAVAVEWLNGSPVTITDAVECRLFQDVDADGAFGPGDVELAVASEPGPYLPGRVSDLTLPLPGYLLPYPEVPLSVEFDPHDRLVESDETNNVSVVGHPCRDGDVGIVPAADLALQVDSVILEAEPFPGCGFRARVTGWGHDWGSAATNVPTRVTALWDLTMPVAEIVMPIIEAGGSAPFAIEFPVTETGIFALYWADELVPDCGVKNHWCVFRVDTLPSMPPAPIGDTLFATAHGAHDAPICTADFEWMGDLGAPRPPGELYAVFQAESPELLTQGRGYLVRAPLWRSATPRSASRRCHYVVALAVDACGRREP